MNGLTPHEIRVLLYNEQITITQLAKEIPASRPWIYAAINRKGSNPGQKKTGRGVTTYCIRRHIAKRLDVSYKVLWGEEDPHSWYGQFLKSRQFIEQHAHNKK